MTPGEAFARAIAAKDAGSLKTLLSPDLDFKALTPGRFWEADSVDATVDEVILGSWFDSTDEIEELESVRPPRWPNASEWPIAFESEIPMDSSSLNNRLLRHRRRDNQLASNPPCGLPACRVTPPHAVPSTLRSRPVFRAQGDTGGRRPHRSAGGLSPNSCWRSGPCLSLGWSSIAPRSSSRPRASLIRSEGSGPCRPRSSLCTG